MGENLPQPAHQLGFGCSSELRLFLVGVKERLLDDVGRVEPSLISASDMRPGQQVKVRTVGDEIAFGRSVVKGWCAHGQSFRDHKDKDDDRASTQRVRASFFSRATLLSIKTPQVAYLTSL